MQGTMNPFERAMALAALSGLKIALGPAFLATSRKRDDARQWTMAAAGEMAVDKLGILPSRSSLPLLVPHTLAGAWVAQESMKAEGAEDPYAGVLGGVVAAGVATVAPMIRIALRKIVGIPDPVLGLAEDYLALRLGMEATGLTMDEIRDAARAAVEDVPGMVGPMVEMARPMIDKARPTLESAGVHI